MAANIQALAEKAAERLRNSSDKSDLNFYNITEAVVRGSGISNSADLNRVTKQVRDQLRQFSANKRKAAAQAKKDARAFARKIAS